MVATSFLTASIKLPTLLPLVVNSVDYTVHLCHSYTHSPQVSSYDRTKQAATEMGVSIVSGMITSLFASLPLLFTALTFFRQFGTFMCATVVFSLLMAVFFFMSLTSQVGPKREVEGGKSNGDLCGGSGNAKVVAMG